MTSAGTTVLSVCIPTFNRAALLQETLLSVLASLAGFEDQVEILISDNASTDNTREVVTKFQNLYPKIRYNRNPVNVIDKNFFIAAGLATGKYVWVFADDDLMELNAVGRVLKEISNGYNLLILNHSVWNNDFSAGLKDKFICAQKDNVFTDHNKFLQYFSIKAQLISAVVIKKDVLLTLPEGKYGRFHEYGCSFLLAMYTGVAENINALLISDALVRYRGDNSDLREVSIWYKYFATGSTLFFREIRKYGYSAWSCYRAKYPVLKYYIVPNISHNRRSGKSMKGIFRLILPYYALHAYFWVIIVPLLFAPVSALHALYRLKCRFRN